MIVELNGLFLSLLTLVGYSFAAMRPLLRLPKRLFSPVSYLLLVKVIFVLVKM